MAIDRADWHWDTAEKEFRETNGITGGLTQEQIKTYHILSDMQGENASKDNEALYIQGFKDGALLMMEILSE